MKRKKFHEWVAIYAQHHENGYVRRNYVTPEGDKLGMWFDGIRRHYDQLSEERKQALKAAGYRHYVSRWEDSFDAYLAEFVLYSDDGDMRKDFISPSGMMLGLWVQRVRSGAVILTEERRAKLDAVNFKWHSQRGPRKTKPEKPRRAIGRTGVFFEEYLREFDLYNQNGNVPTTFISPSGMRLGAWVARIRNGRYKLTTEQRRLLEERGFKWRMKRGRVKQDSK